MRRAPAVFFSLAILGFACGPGDRESSGGVIPEPGQGPRGRADSLYAEGAFSEARDRWLEDLRQVRAAGDDEAAAALLTSLGLVARHLGDYASSRAWGEEGLELKLRLGLDGELFRSYNALGLLAWTEGRLDDASRLFTEASRSAAAVGDDLSVAKALANLAQIDTDQGEWSSARRGFQALEQASRAAADTILLGRALINVAMLD
ncbi:MAG TPA: tetratricopeptide repeat protein, partial [Longimicrobiales bacterium]|nr:tetratricopeptide repeat protein [Longimicrobiales bacterium]